MRKKVLKKKWPFRHRIIEQLRETYSDNIKIIRDSRGNEIALNLKKHFLYGKPYINDEYQRELNRFTISRG